MQDSQKRTVTLKRMTQEAVEKKNKIFQECLEKQAYIERLEYALFDEAAKNPTSGYWYHTLVEMKPAPIGFKRVYLWNDAFKNYFGLSVASITDATLIAGDKWQNFISIDGIPEYDRKTIDCDARLETFCGRKTITWNEFHRFVMSCCVREN